MDKDVSEEYVVSIFNLELCRARNRFGLYRDVAKIMVTQNHGRGENVELGHDQQGDGSEKDLQHRTVSQREH
jgi:hypothetical protein